MHAAIVLVQILRICTILHIGSNRLSVTATPCPGEFKCSQSEDCVDLSWVCDGADDCEDMSDEQNCVSGVCGPERFECRCGRCIHSSLACNGVDDCGDMSDEQNCVRCHPGRFKCLSGRCIPPDYICDGDDDCGDKSDEQNCGTFLCPGAFMCRGSRRCIEFSWVCDGDSDCEDKSDEQNCDFRNQYIGCFKDSGEDRAMGAGYTGKNVNLNRCREQCSGVKSTFFAAEASNWCYCADEYDKHGALTDSKCSWPCVNGNNQKCGGNFALSVYWVCPVGYYGRNCTKRCSSHCRVDARLGTGCYMDGRCPGGCETGWTSASCDTADVEQSSNNATTIAVTVVAMCGLAAVLLAILYRLRVRLVRRLRAPANVSQAAPVGAPGTTVTGGALAAGSDRPTPRDYETIVEHVLTQDANSNKVNESKYLVLIQSRGIAAEDTHYEELN